MVASPLQGEGEGEGSVRTVGVFRAATPHLHPSPLSKGRGGKRIGGALPASISLRMKLRLGRPLRLATLG